MLRDGTFYNDLGPTYLDRLGSGRRIESLVKRLNDLWLRSTAHEGRVAC